ncbi:pentatricopeptide repeat-containing protein-like [Iris pallida]|uniref:Pentatricopeptide repeat-containing protein-like n=1 Tax=Iris pallida TaxID=29817 RepID=A0AAX6DX91_IRIPA|nr:pentatricopeptide repeat-containing protein-like [Iris pallida]
MSPPTPTPTPAQLSSLVQHYISNKLLPLLHAKSIHSQIIKHPSLSHDTFLYNRLLHLYSQSNATSLNHSLRLFLSIPSPNIFSWNSILSAASRAADAGVACHLFDRMPERNVVSWNTVISALSRTGSERKALDFYYSMLSEGFVPTHFTFASVLSACGSLAGLEDGRRCHGLIAKVGLTENSFVGNALVGMYTKCGCVDDALKLFDSMANPNEVSFTAMMGGLVSSGSANWALRLFARMHRRQVAIDPIAVSSVLGACARAEEDRDRDFDEILLGQSVQALVFKNGFDSDHHVGNSLIDMYAKRGDMASANLVFNSLPVTNVVSWNVLIAGYGQRGDGKKAIQMIESMKQHGFEPDEVTYISLLGACTKAGDVETARRVLNNISSPSVAAWNAVLTGYCQEESYQKALELFRRMQHQHIPPDRTTLAVILTSCSGRGLLGIGKEVHAFSVRCMLQNDMFVASGLVDMYSKCGRIESARNIFDRMPERDVVSWNSMITGFALHSLNKEAFSFFRMMQENGFAPTEFSYASVINSCARLSSSPQGRQIHAQTAQNGYDADIYVGSALIDMYSKCGDVDEAYRFFDCMPTKNIVSWNEMIHGYAQNGLGEKAVAIFEQMLSFKEKPDGVTFISVLTACSHSGLVDEGFNLLKSMEDDYGIEPLADHYTCVIDSLGRAGRLGEAEELVNRMKWKDDPIVWEVLLSSCAVHGEARLGRRAAEELFRLDPENSAPYVLLSNIYAGLGQYKEASNVRALMRDNGVVKDRGYSWIDHKSGVRAFMVDDGEGKLSSNVEVYVS